MKGGTLCTKFALAGLGLSSFISFCKKWYIRDEVCGLTKKKEIKKLVTVRVGHFSLEKRRLKTRRDRLKSAPYLRLRNIQGTTIGNICKEIIFFKKKIFENFSETSIF